MVESKIEEAPRNSIDFDSDSDVDEDGMSKADWERYYHEVESSGGYDVSEYHSLSCGMIIPIDVHDDEEEELSGYAKVAVDNFNGENHTNFKFVELLKGTVSVVSGFMFYITFKVEDVNSGKTETFQARVWSKIPGPNGEDRFEIKECRIKPTSS